MSHNKIIFGGYFCFLLLEGGGVERGLVFNFMIYDIYDDFIMIYHD